MTLWKTPLTSEGMASHSWKDTSKTRKYITAALASLWIVLSAQDIQAQRHFEEIIPDISDPASVNIFTSADNALGQWPNRIDSMTSYSPFAIFVWSNGEIYDTEAEVSPTRTTWPVSMNIQWTDFESSAWTEQDIFKMQTIDHTDTLDLSADPLTVWQNYFTTNGWSTVEWANTHYDLANIPNGMAMILYSGSYGLQSGSHTWDHGVAFYNNNGSIERITSFQGDPFPLGESFTAPLGNDEGWDNPDLSISPNPASERMNINIPWNMISEIDGDILPIYNMKGEHVTDISIQWSNTAAYWDWMKCKADVSKLPAGIYQIGGKRFVIAR